MKEFLSLPLDQLLEVWSWNNLVSGNIATYVYFHILCLWFCVGLIRLHCSHDHRERPWSGGDCPPGTWILRCLASAMVIHRQGHRGPGSIHRFPWSPQDVGRGGGGPGTPCSWTDRGAGTGLPWGSLGYLRFPPGEGGTRGRV